MFKEGRSGELWERAMFFTDAAWKYFRAGNMEMFSKLEAVAEKMRDIALRRESFYADLSDANSINQDHTDPVADMTFNDLKITQVDVPSKRKSKCAIKI
jgi:hypothetical protein